MIYIFNYISNKAYIKETSMSPLGFMHKVFIFLIYFEYIYTGWNIQQ